MKSKTISALLLMTLAIAASAQTAPQPPNTGAPAAAPQAPSPAPNPPNPNTQPTANGNGTYTITRNARLVILDMVVTDAKGNVIIDLRKDDFNVTEMNEPQTVLNFEPAGAHTIPLSMDINST